MTLYQSQHPIENLETVCEVMRSLTPYGCTRSRVLKSPSMIGGNSLQQSSFILCGVGGGLCRIHQLIESRSFALVVEEPLIGCPDGLSDDQIREVGRKKGVEGI